MTDRPADPARHRPRRRRRRRRALRARRRAATPTSPTPTVDSPVGPLVAAGTDRGLVRLAYEDFDGGLDAVLDDARRAPLAADPRGAARGSTPSRRELDEYFEGRRDAFDVPIDWSLVDAASGAASSQATARDPVRRDVDLRAGRGAGRQPAGRHARPATRSAPTRSRSSSPATASCAPAARSAATPAAWTARRRCCGSRASCSLRSLPARPGAGTACPGSGPTTRVGHERRWVTSRCADGVTR